MTFGLTLGEHFTMAASASMFYVAINYDKWAKYEGYL